MGPKSLQHVLERFADFLFVVSLAKRAHCLLDYLVSWLVAHITNVSEQLSTTAMHCAVNQVFRIYSLLPAEVVLQRVAIHKQKGKITGDCIYWYIYLYTCVYNNIYTSHTIGLPAEVVLQSFAEKKR